MVRLRNVRHHERGIGFPAAALLASVIAYKQGKPLSLATGLLSLALIGLAVAASLRES